MIGEITLAIYSKDYEAIDLKKELLFLLVNITTRRPFLRHPSHPPPTSLLSPLELNMWFYNRGGKLNFEPTVQSWMESQCICPNKDSQQCCCLHFSFTWTGNGSKVWQRLYCIVYSLKSSKNKTFWDWMHIMRLEPMYNRQSLNSE